MQFRQLPSGTVFTDPPTVTPSVKWRALGAYPPVSRTLLAWSAGFSWRVGTAPSFSWRAAPVTPASCWPVRHAGAAGLRGALLVGASVRDRGEAGEQLSHLDAEDAGDGERAVD